MPWQLIYTSAPRGLKPGQTGFCTVACSENLREIIVQRLERWSVYHHLTLQASTTGISNPIIAVYRILDLRDEKYHVLSRIQDAGQDFTLRSNHLAHHLVFSSAELLEMPSPAAILLLWKGWRNRWDGPPTLLGAHETQDLSELRETRLLPARNWQQMTGDAASAAGFLGLEHKRVIFVTAPGHEQMLLALYAEALQLLDPVGQSPLSAWQYPFTTFLQAEDALSEFYWRGGRNGTPGYESAIRAGLAPVEPSSIPAGNTDLGYLARQGRPAPTKVETPVEIPKPTNKPEPKLRVLPKPVSAPPPASPVAPPSPPGLRPATAPKRLKPREFDMAEFEKVDRMLAKRPRKKSALKLAIVALLLLAALVALYLVGLKKPAKDIVFKTSDRPGETNAAPLSARDQTNQFKTVERPKSSPDYQVFFDRVQEISCTKLTNYASFITNFFKPHLDNLGGLACEVFSIDDKQPLQNFPLNASWGGHDSIDFTTNGSPWLTAEYSSEAGLKFKIRPGVRLSSESRLLGVQLSWKSRDDKERSKDVSMNFIAIPRPAEDYKPHLPNVLRLDAGDAAGSFVEPTWTNLVQHMKLPSSYRWCFVPYNKAPVVGQDRWIFANLDPQDCPAMGLELNFSNLCSTLSKTLEAAKPVDDKNQEEAKRWIEVKGALNSTYKLVRGQKMNFEQFCKTFSRTEQIADAFYRYIKLRAETQLEQDPTFLKVLGKKLEILTREELINACGFKAAYDALNAKREELGTLNWDECVKFAATAQRRLNDTIAHLEHKKECCRALQGGWSGIARVELWICRDNEHRTRVPNFRMNSDYPICVFDIK